MQRGQGMIDSPKKRWFNWFVALVLAFPAVGTACGQGIETETGNEGGGETEGGEGEGGETEGGETEGETEGEEGGEGGEGEGGAEVEVETD